MKILFRLLLALLLPLGITACGLHLRSANEFPPQLKYIYLETPNPNSAFSAQLTQLLQGMGTRIAPQPTAPIVLHIQSAQFIANQPNVISSSVVTVYTYNYNVQFSIEDNHGNIILPPMNISVAQSIYAAPNQMLTGTSTSARVENSLRTQVLQLLTTELTTTRVRTALDHSTS